jgi:hypothetical protein
MQMSTHEPRGTGPATLAEPRAHRRAVGADASTARPQARDPLVLGPLAAPIGWLTAWGAAALAAACLTAAGVDLGLGLGLGGASADELTATAAVASPDFWPSVWLLIVQLGAFILGGYASARLARRNALLHAGGVWLLAMVATGADAVVAASRDTAQVVASLTIPSWVDNGLQPEAGTGLALALFALISLAGALLGGMLGRTVNRAEPFPAR